MNLSTAVRRQNNGIQRLKDLYSKARSYHMTCTDIANESVKVRNLEVIPRHVKEYLRGYDHALWEGLYQDLEFCYVIDGKIYSVDKKSDRYYEKFGIQPCELSDKPCAHFWKGTDKPFSTVEPL